MKGGRAEDGARGRVVSQRPLSGPPGHAGRADRRSACADRRGRRAERGGEPRQARALRRHRRRAASSGSSNRATCSSCAASSRRVRGPIGRGKAERPGRRRARVPRNSDFRGGAEVIGKAQGAPISITGLGAYVPDRVADERRARDARRHVRTSGSWSARGSASAGSPRPSRRSPISRCRLPRSRHRRRRESRRQDLDLVLCATVTPDMMFPTSSALLADTLGARDAAAYDLLGRAARASCTRSCRPTE